eukprot:UN05519
MYPDLAWPVYHTFPQNATILCREVHVVGEWYVWGILPAIVSFSLLLLCRTVLCSQKSRFKYLEIVMDAYLRT